MAQAEIADTVRHCRLADAQRASVVMPAINRTLYCARMVLLSCSSMEVRLA
jgi:hypothetical protein